MHLYYKHKNRICFSRWSRKSYSLFACLGKEVVIGTLKYKLADIAMKAIQSFPVLLNAFIEDEIEDEDLSEEIDDFWQKELFTYSAVPALSTPVAKSIHFYITYRK